MALRCLAVTQICSTSQCQREIRLKGKLQLHLGTELASCCSQVMGHVCAPPHLNLTAAVVGTVITEVRHKSEKVFLFLKKERRQTEGETDIASGSERGLILWLIPHECSFFSVVSVSSSTLVPWLWGHLALMGSKLVGSPHHQTPLPCTC